MDRLTKHDQWNDSIGLTQELGYKFIYDKLAQYEATGLSPDAIKYLLKISKLSSEEVNILAKSMIYVGMPVWVVTEYRGKKKITKASITRILIKARYSFSVKGALILDGGVTDVYYGTFTPNSIGKTVFFTEEEAIKSKKL